MGDSIPDRRRQQQLLDRIQWISQGKGQGGLCCKYLKTNLHLPSSRVPSNTSINKKPVKIGTVRNRCDAQLQKVRLIGT